jgi:hydrophobe/amphiphile efflux-3 (HAE3) family protein
VTPASLLAALAGSAARRTRLVLALALLVGAAGAAVALRLHPTAAASTLVSSSSPEYAATQRFYAKFGEEPVQVLVRGDLQQLLLSSDIDRLVGLEGCLSGNVPPSAFAREGGPRGPCAQLARARSIKVVLGPGTFVNEAATEIDEALAAQNRQARGQARAAERAVLGAALARGLGSAQAHALAEQARKINIARFQESLAVLALQYGLTAQPSLDNADFVTSLVFDSSKPAGTPKQRFAYLFPARDAALISVRMRAGLSERQRTRTIALIRRAVAMPQWRLQRGGSYHVTGEPAIVADLTHSISRSIELLLVAVVVVIALALALLLSWRRRLLPLAVALLAASLTFGALSLIGASLTMASIAVLPVLVGLAVDYAIQFQSRVHEQLEREPHDRALAVRSAAARSAPAIATAAAAAAAAMLVLLTSPVPMVRGFGVLLVGGVLLGVLCAFSAGAAALALPQGGSRGGIRAPVRGPRAAGLAAAWRGARELLWRNPFTRVLSRAALERAVRRPALVLGIGLALAALGWGLDTQTRVETDIAKLVPQNLSSLQNLNTLERLTGVGGEIDLMVSGRDLTRSSTLEWMSSYQDTVLKRFGYSTARGCGKARLCPAFSLPDLFSARGAGTGTRTRLSQNEVDSLLKAIPPYFSQDVITPDHRTATLAFGIRLMSLSQQQQLIDTMRRSLHPPRGIHASLVGLPVLAAKSGAQVASPLRRVLTLLGGLLAVALVLAFAFRREPRRVLVPLVPIVLATGWSALILFAVRVPLNPMSVTLGVLVIAISTEFSVLLCEREREERRAGHAPREALMLAYRRTGAAVAASGVTAIAGFAVLVLSDIRMLRDFGLVTLIDLSVSLLGVLVSLPAALTLADRLQAAPRRVSRAPLPRRLRWPPLGAGRRSRAQPGHEGR